MASFERDDNFYSLGFTRAEDYERFHEQASKPTSKGHVRRQRPRPKTRDFESDMDHRDQMEALPEGFTPEPLEGGPFLPGTGRDMFRIALAQLKREREEAHIQELAGDDPVRQAALRRAHHEDRSA